MNEEASGPVMGKLLGVREATASSSSPPLLLHLLLFLLLLQRGRITLLHSLVAAPVCKRRTPVEGTFHSFKGVGLSSLGLLSSAGEATFYRS